MPLLRQNSSPIDNLSELFPDLPISMFESLREKIFESTQAKIDAREAQEFREEKAQFDQEVNDYTDSDEIINATLLNGGIAPDKLNLPDPNANHFQQVLHKNGASVENASKVIASVMMNGKFENSKLKAAEMVLDLHGIREADGKVKRTPSFQFVIKDSNVNIQQIFAPQRSATSIPSNVCDISPNE